MLFRLACPLLLLLAALAVLALPARAQVPAASPAPDTAAGPPLAFPSPEGRPLKGMAWQPPADLAQAARALRRMKAAGVEAVRTPLIRRERLLTVADSLRLRLFQDLPAAYLSAGGLTEALPGLRWELERALLQARRHPSARHFGLLSRSDTSVPRVCEMVRALAARVEAYGPAEAVTYYETPFVGSDRCAGAADLTLLSALNHDDPQALLRRWHQAQADTTGADTTRVAPDAVSEAMSVGIGALGTWVNPEAEGLKAPHSPASQARYFERHLSPLLRPTEGTSTPGVRPTEGANAPLGVRDSMRTRAAGSAPSRRAVRSDSLAAPAVVFAYRWRDETPEEAQPADPQPSASQAFSLADPYGRRYGLHAASGTPRPALKVVRGLYTGRQRVFAFPAGQSPPGRLPWLVLAGWGLVAVLGVFYASTSRFRSMVQRYFSAPGFYRDAVREGREALASSSLVLLTAVSLCAGLIVTVFLLAVQETGPFVQMLRGASGGTQDWILTLLRRPWLAILLGALFYFLSLGAWAFFLSLATRQSYSLRLEQTLVLVVWPRWPAFLLAAAAIVATTLPPGWMLSVSGALAAAWVLVSMWAAVRALYDLALLTNLSPVVTPALLLLNPVLLAAVMVFFAVLEFLPEATFLWHLATRS